MWNQNNGMMKSSIIDKPNVIDLAGVALMVRLLDVGFLYYW
jgi:hypothetical protein